MLNILKKDAAKGLNDPTRQQEINGEISEIKNSIKPKRFFGKNLDKNKKTLIEILSTYKKKQ
jgi:hypothetical protein